MRGIFDCPDCGSEDIEERGFAESHPQGHDFEHYELGCNECGAEWFLHYEDGEWWVQGDDDYEEVA